MRIGINAQLLAFGQDYRHAGLSKYIYHLLQHLPLVDAANEYVYFMGPGPRPPDFAAAPNVRVVETHLPTRSPEWRILWEQAIQPLSLRRHRIDVVHAPVQVLPYLHRSRAVVTVHDLAFMLFPERYHSAKQRYLRHLTAASVRRAARVVAVSTNTKADLVRLLRVPPERIVVVPNGVDERFQPVDPAVVRAFRARQQLPERFVLYVGTLEPRKNLPRLVEAFARCREQIDARLVIGGSQGWMFAEVFALIERLHLQEHVLLPGYLAEDDLAAWYAAADLFVYPSLYEGFGVPPLEAMAVGTPVVASNTSSLPEVVGDAALTVDPTDVEALAAAMVRGMTDEPLRERLRAAGRERARGYSWRAVAKRMAEVYQQVGGDGGSRGARER